MSPTPKQSNRLHEVVLEVRRSVLVTTLRHCLVCKEIVVRMVPLMRLLFSLPRNARLILLPRLLRCPVALSQFLEPIIAILSQIRLLLDFRLVEPVHNWVFTLHNVDALNLSAEVRGLGGNRILVGEGYLLGIFEAYLPGRHAAVFLEV